MNYVLYALMENVLIQNVNVFDMDSLQQVGVKYNRTRLHKF